MSDYTYDLTDFANDVVCEDKLTLEIAGSSIATELTSMSSDEEAGECVLTFVSALSGADETMLDAIVAAHDAIMSCYRFHAASTLVQGEIAITETSEWQVLGGVVTTPSFFCRDVTKLLARIIGSKKSDGDGLEIRVMENGSTVLASASFDSTSDVWTQVKFYSSTSPGVGTSEYTLQARLNSATSGSVRFFSMSLLEAVA